MLFHVRLAVVGPPAHVGFRDHGVGLCWIADLGGISDLVGRGGGLLAVQKISVFRTLVTAGLRARDHSSGRMYRRKPQRIPDPECRLEMASRIGHRICNLLRHVRRPEPAALATPETAAGTFGDFIFPLSFPHADPGVWRVAAFCESGFTMAPGWPGVGVRLVDRGRCFPLFSAHVVWDRASNWPGAQVDAAENRRLRTVARADLDSFHHAFITFCAIH